MRAPTLQLAMVLALSTTWAPAALAIEPAVARPHFVVGSDPRAGGTAFFVAAPGDAGAVAITTAHGIALADLARSAEVSFELAAGKQRVSVASRLHAAPGRSFTETGARLRDDFLIFALDLAPRGVRMLALCSADCAPVGQRVRILGAPGNAAADEDDVFGQVTKSDADQIEVLLDVPADLRGWGGGPVLRQPGGEVIGLLEAQWPDDEGLRLGIAPIDGVRTALAHPLDAGLGRSFASFGPAAKATARATSARGPTHAAPEPTGAAPLDDHSEQGPLLGAAEVLTTEIRLAIDYPPDGGIVTDEQGAFVAGQALALLGEYRRFDVMLVLDTSDSTRAASGSDVNQNGVVGENRAFGFLPTTDAGDSILAAEVAAARRVLENFDARSTRVGVVSFAGVPLPPPGAFVVGAGQRPAALTEQALTSEYREVEKALDHILARGPDGLTNMTEGLRLAVRELKGYAGGFSEPDPDSAKIVLFFTDGQPTLPYDNSPEQNLRSVLRAAGQARRSRVIVHTFALGPEALERPAAVVDMARISGGRFTPVRKAGDLIRVIEDVSFANLDQLTVRNQTLDRAATELVRKADGSFGALVPMQPGRNVIEVWARASDGKEARVQVAVQQLVGASAMTTPAELMALRSQLLEKRIVSLRRNRIEAERESGEGVRRALELEIEQERGSAEARAAQQRRELRIEPAPEGEADAAP